ncbi:Uncharacterized protein SCF082_LOCUS25897 [Durusdinium trenchii]|uniref:Ubiquitin-like domain-containing protein n=1 Tax=Durusdinium trenchii TaxID=1381693 RepID=A0ABP0M4B0_9DINO
MAESSITFKVSMISGAEGTVSGDAAETLADVKGKVMEVLNLSMSSVSLFLDSAPGEELQDDRSIKDLSGCNLLVVVPSEPEWCTNKCFTQEYIRGRRCGMEETSEDVEVRILSGGEFAFKRKHHDHDAECGYSHDSSVTAQGTWLVRWDPTQKKEVLELTGEATRRETQRVSRTRYDSWDRDDHEDDEEEEEEEDQNYDRTTTEKFNKIFTKDELLTTSAGRYTRDGWKVAPI